MCKNCLVLVGNGTSSKEDSCPTLGKLLIEVQLSNEKRGYPGCLAYKKGIKYYAGTWGICHKPRNKDHPAGFFVVAQLAMLGGKNWAPKKHDPWGIIPGTCECLLFWDLSCRMVEL